MNNEAESDVILFSSFVRLMGFKVKALKLGCLIKKSGQNNGHKRKGNGIAFAFVALLGTWVLWYQRWHADFKT